MAKYVADGYVATGYFDPGTWVTSDFTREVVNDIDDSGRWDAFYTGGGSVAWDVILADDVLRLTGDSFKVAAAIHIEEFSSTDQCVRLKVVDGQSGSPVFTTGAFLRVDSAGTGECYRVAIAIDNITGESVSWSRYDGFVWQTTIQESGSDYVVSNGDYVGFAVKGTGSSTYVYFWNLGTSLPDTGAWDGVEGAGSNWGNYTWKSSTDPSTDAVDTGVRVGIAGYQTAGGTYHEVTDFGGGDVLAGTTYQRAIVEGLRAGG